MYNWENIRNSKKIIINTLIKQQLQHILYHKKYINKKKARKKMVK